MNLKLVPLVVAGALAGPAFGVTVNMTDFSFADPRAVVITNTASTTPDSAYAGRFVGTLVDTGSAGAAADPSFRSTLSAAVAGSSFTAYCAELSQGFDFGTSYSYSWTAGTGYFGAAKYDALSRLFTATEGFVVNSDTSAAMQAAIWEIIYETAPTYSLTADSFKIAPPSGASSSTFAAFATVNGVLGHLSSYSALYSIKVLTNGAAQDFLVATAVVPEPASWALLAGGLGVIGLLARRRRS